MNKNELSKIIAQRTDTSADVVLEILNAMTEEIALAMKNGDEVKLFGFGKFQARTYK